MDNTTLTLADDDFCIVCHADGSRDILAPRDMDSLSEGYMAFIIGFMRLLAGGDNFTCDMVAAGMELTAMVNPTPH